MSRLSSELRRLTAKAENLLEAHQSGRNLEEFEVYADDPVGFIREVLGEEPWARQVEIAEAVRDGAQVAVRSCHGAGKDWLGARLALWWCYGRRGLAVISGPTAAQVEEILMRKELRRAYRGAGDLPGELHVRALRPTGAGKAGIIAKTASETGGLTGFHDARVLFLITEAQDERTAPAWDASYACTTGEKDRVLALGNPVRPAGRFYQASRSPDWRAVKIPASDVPNVRQGRTVIPGLITREGVDRIVRDYGEESSFVEARIRAEFPEQALEGLYSREWFEEAVGRWEMAQESRWAPDWGKEEPILAVDPSRYGADKTVAALRKGPVVPWIRSRGGGDLEETADWISELAEGADMERRHDFGGGSGFGRIVVDTVGLGAGLFDMLKRRQWRVSEFKSSTKPRGSKARDRFRNARAQAYWELRDQLERGELALPDDEELFTELLEVQWSPTSNDRVQLESKTDMRNRLGRSPDRADAVVMALHGQTGGRAAKKRIVKF